METQFPALNIPPIQQRERIPLRAIQAVVDLIAENFEPDKIILFGSHAYGNPQPWSDVDLLVVMDTEQHPVAISQEILKSLPAFFFSVDIIVRSAETIHSRAQMGDAFMEEITEKGKVLYERPNQ